MPIKETMTNIKEFINSLITTEMSTEDINKYQGIISSCDSVINESDLKDKDLAECKESLVRFIKTSGSKQEPPKTQTKSDEPKPKSMEEIAQEILNKEKW